MSTAIASDARQRHLPWRVAGRLLQAAKREESEHTILRENVAHLLGQLDPAYVDSLEHLPLDKTIESLNGSYAASNGKVEVPLKISRDLRWKPYTDQEVMQRIEDLDAKLKVEVQKVVEQSRPYPCRFFTCGSIEKGHFGARSDVDLLVQASPDWMRDQRFKLSHDDVSIQMIDMDDAKTQQQFIDAFAPTRPVTPEEIAQPGFLMGIYRQGLEKKGYALEDGHLVPTRDVSFDPEVPPEAAKHIMWSLPMV